MADVGDVALDEVQWRSPEWIQMYGLRTDNVLEYFSLSPFYDRSSNNQVLKMQSAYNEQLQNRKDLQKELKNMKGTEFVLAASQEPDMWVIRRQNRSSPVEAEILATYFVVGENIYQAPSVYAVVTSRLLSTTKSITEALETAQNLAKFTPRGYSYAQAAPAAAAPAASNGPATGPATGEEESMQSTPVGEEFEEANDTEIDEDAREMERVLQISLMGRK